VTGGTSDVEVTSFRQESHGMLLGPSTSTKNVWTDRNFTGIGAVKATGLTNCRPLVVPFGAFANNNVTKGGIPITNITNAELRLIFSGQIFNWGDLAGYDSKDIRVCLRHAGSGTHATMDLVPMSPAALSIYEDAMPGSGYEFWFNDSGQDVLNCLSGAGTMGAIGYADADATKPAGVNALTYNGVQASKENLKNGSYDWYAVQNLYTATPRSADMTNLCNHMKNPANNNNAWYPVACEMKYIRLSDTGAPVLNPEYCGQ
jgi:ABC-type phosphate transport system substrate-binding protein